MAEQHIGENMEINSNIVDAAHKLVRAQEFEEDQTYEIPGYKGMFVAISSEGQTSIQGLSYFTEGNRRYTVGTMQL